MCPVATILDSVETLSSKESNILLIDYNLL